MTTTLRDASDLHASAITSHRSSYALGSTTQQNGDEDVVKDTVPLIAAPAASTVIVDWASKRAAKAAFYEQPDAPPPPADPPKVSMFSLLSFSTKKERWLMGFGMFWAAVSGLAMPVWLLLLAQSLDTFNNLGKIINTVGADEAADLLKEQMNKLIWSFVILGVVSLFSGSFYVSLWTYTGERQSLRIRQAFVRSAFQQDQKWFDSRGDPQELPTLAANALTKINDGIGRKIADTFANLLSSIVCLCVAIGLDPPLALMMLAMLPVVALCIGVISIFLRRNSGRALAEYASAGAFATEVISGIKTVASLCVERWAVGRYAGTVRKAQGYAIRSGYYTGLSSGVTGFLFYAAYSYSFIFGTEQVANTGDVENSKLNPFYCMFNYCGISGAEVLACIYGVILCAQFFTMMAPGIQSINLARQAAVDIFATINRKPEIDASSENGRTIDGYQGLIEMQNVAFSYPSHPDNLVFNNFNLRIQAGSSVALVGPSGSGKSTIAKLLLRFYDPIQGDVLANGVSLRDINLKWWRSQIGYVPQEPHLFIGSIRDNIASGKSSDDKPATDEEVFAAARAACADDFIRDLPDGYNTFYSGASIQLSGGQIQRIAIARALIREPAILLLDEATSALDSQSEKSVQDALANIRKTKKLTTVTVAHRLSTIIASDQIAVISDGGIAELGTHSSLLDQGGIYATLCESQGITKDSLVDDTSPAVDSSTLAVGSVADKGLVDLKPSGDPDDVEAGKDASENLEKPMVEADVEVEETDTKGTRKRLWSYNKPEWCYIVTGVIGACVTGVLHPSEGILYAQIVANFFVLEPDEMRVQNRFLSLCFLALAGGALFGNMAMASGFSVSGFRLTRRMRVLTFEKIVRHSMGWFDSPEHSTGELTIRLEEDAEAVSSVTGWGLGYNIQVVSSLVSGIIIALSFSWQIGLIAIACVPFIMFSSFVQARCVKYSQFKQDGVSASTILEQGLREISLVQAYNLQEEQADSYDAALEPLSKHKVKEGAVAGLTFGFAQFAIFTTFSILFYAGIQLMTKRKVDFTSFFTALLAIMFAAFSLGQANSDFNAQRNGLKAANRIFALVDEPLDSTDPFSSVGSTPSSLDGSIGFDSCCFAYPTRPDHPIFYPSGDRYGFTLSIDSKESVAFTGRSGCGKSTALQLVLRFYDVNSGQVMLDKSNIESLNITWLRSNIGYVGQQPVLFAGTVRENILLGKQNATDDELVSAAKAANAHDFVTQLSDGYETQIGSGGSLLSGGQKQRIAIARAIISNPPILVLDEITSALDNESESIVQAALDEMQKTQPRTTLTVAHRLKTIEKCDKICVLGGGGVQELGSHDELLEKKGLYYDLWLKQGEKEE